MQNLSEKNRQDRGRSEILFAHSIVASLTRLNVAVLVVSVTIPVTTTVPVTLT